jgi:hypothetical protein
VTEHKYTLEQYVAVGSIEQLVKNFGNEEYFAQRMIENRDFIQNIINDPEWGKRRVAEYNVSIKDSTEAMENIAKAIQILEHERKNR